MRTVETRPEYVRRPTVKEYAFLELLAVHRGVWFSEASITSLPLWEGEPPEDLSKMIRILRAELVRPEGILKIAGAAGYVYYPSVTDGQIIFPEGFRPNPILNIRRNTALYTLFDSLRFAKIRKDLHTADPAIPHQRYKLLTMLAKARIQSRGVSTAEISREFGLPMEGIRVLRDNVMQDLFSLVGIEWSVVHPRTNRLIPPEWDMHYLTNIYEPVKFIVPSGRPNPQSVIENNTVVL